MDERQKIKVWLKELREAHGFTIFDVARMLETTIRTVQRLEDIKEPGFPHGFEMLRYLKILGVLVDSPVEMPALGRLAAIEVAVTKMGAQTASGLAAVERAIDDLTDRLPQSDLDGAEAHK